MQPLNTDLDEIDPVHDERVHHGIFQRSLLPVLAPAEDETPGDVDAIPMQRQRELVRRTEIRTFQQGRQNSQVDILARTWEEWTGRRCMSGKGRRGREQGRQEGEREGKEGKGKEREGIGK